jgi:2,4-dienoyl-CoA reductase (NADPH2)
VNYERIDDDGLRISFGPDRQRPRLLAADNVVICAGQEPVRDLESELRRNGIDPHIIGGAALATELDAKRAIRQGTELAARLYPAAPPDLRLVTPRQCSPMMILKEKMLGAW